jgi:hypothetical protein
VASQSCPGGVVEAANEVTANQSDALTGGLREAFDGRLVPLFEASDTSAVLASDQSARRARWKRPK